MSSIDKDVSIGIKESGVSAAKADSSRSSINVSQDSSPKSSFALQAVWLQVLSLSASAIILIYLTFSVHQFLRAQSLYEAAQQQRIYNQRYAKEVLLAGGGVPVSYQKTSREWSHAMELLAQGGDLDLGEGQPIQKVQPPLDQARFKGDLERLAQAQRQIVSESEDYLQSAKLTQYRVELFDELYRQSLEFQAAGDALVGAYDKHLDSGVSWWDVNAVAVEMAERQRMLIQQHIKEVLFVAHGVPADYQTTRLRLYESLRILTEGGTLSLDNKDAIEVPAPGSEDIRFNLKQQKESLDRFTAVSNQFLMLSNEDVERSIRLKKISDLTIDFHDASTELLAKYRGFFEGRVKGAARDAGAAGLLTVIFVLFLTWSFARKYVEIPLNNIIDALRKMRDSGDSGVSLEAAPGLAGEAVSELNLYLKKSRERSVWFDQFLSASDPSDLQDPGSEDPVASRVYEWHRRRSMQDQSISRWSSIEDNEIQILGRLPDAEPTISDSDLLDDLLQRANDLQAQQESLKTLNQRLKDEASELSHLDAEHRSSLTNLKAENESLRLQLAQRIADYESLFGQVDGLRLTTSVLQRTESEVSGLFEHVKSQLAEREIEVRSLRDDLNFKRNDLSRAQANLDILKNEIGQAAVNRENLTSIIDENQRVIGVKDALVASLSQRLVETEDRMGVLTASLNQAVLRADAEAARRDEAARNIEDLTRRVEMLAQSHEQQLLKKDSLLADAQREHAAALEIANTVRVELQAMSAEQLRKIEYQQATILHLQQVLADETALLEGARADFSKTSEAHAVELKKFEQLLNGSQEELRNSLARNSAIDQLYQSSLQDHDGTRKALGELTVRLEGREVELWQLRRELADRNAELEGARLSLAREGEVLRSTRESHVIASDLMRVEIDRLKGLLAVMEKEFLEEREQLQSGLKSARDAYRDKCQALSSTEDRLSATRAALKSSLEELQEKFGRAA